MTDKPQGLISTAPPQSETTSRYERITTLCQSVINLNTVIGLSSSGGVSAEGLKTLRLERDRLAADLYDLLIQSEGDLFLAAVGNVRYVGEIAYETHTVYFTPFDEMEQFGQWD